MEHPQARRVHTRRVAVGIAAAAACGAVFAACGSESAPTVAPTTAPTTVRPTTPPTAPTAPAASVAPTAGAAATQAQAPTVAPVAGTGGAASPAATSATAATAPVEGRIPSPAPGVPDAFTKLPPQIKTVNAVPGKGGKVTVFDFAVFPPVPGRDQNQYHRELEKRLGTAIEPTFAPSGNAYIEKFAALAASDSLADLTFLIGPSSEQLRLIQQGAFTDLTSELSGDNLKQYPNLALYPQQIWKNSSIKGKIYGVPRPLSLVGSPLMIRKDWMEKVGIPNPKNADEFFELITRLTKNDPDGNGKADTFGLGSAGSAGSDNVYSITYLQNMFRTPNNWRKNPDGTFVKDHETEEFKSAVAYVRRLFEAGLFHPDSATMSPAQADDFLVGGKIGGYASGIFSLPGPGKLWDKFAMVNPMAGNPVEKLQYLVPPAFDGGKPSFANTTGFFGIAAIPAKVGRDKERVKELLRIVNYYAAPFGSEEWTFMNYGLVGIHHEIKGVELVQTDQGKREIGDFWHLASGERTYFYPTPPGAAKYMQDFSKDALAVGIDDPTLGLYSPTAAARGNELNQLRRDRLLAIISGREPLSALDTMIRDWRSRGGDTIRKEYETELKG